MLLTPGRDHRNSKGAHHVRPPSVVRSVQPDWTIQKVADEGSSSPFMARLMIGVLRLRDNVFDPTNRDDFDKPYDFVLKSLFSARDAMRQMTTLWKEHERKVAAGEIARVERTSIHVDESVDRELGQEAEAFINAAARAVKKGMQDVATVFGVNIGFLFRSRQPLTRASPRCARPIPRWRSTSGWRGQSGPRCSRMRATPWSTKAGHCRASSTRARPTESWRRSRRSAE
jgi:hypothetical protein